MIDDKILELSRSLNGRYKMLSDTLKRLEALKRSQEKQADIFIENYRQYNLDEIDPEVHEIVVKWCEAYCPGLAIVEKHKLANDIMNYAIQAKKQLINETKLWKLIELIYKIGYKEGKEDKENIQ